MLYCVKSQKRILLLRVHCGSFRLHPFCPGDLAHLVVRAGIVALAKAVGGFAEEGQRQHYATQLVYFEPDADELATATHFRPANIWKAASGFLSDALHQMICCFT